MVRETHASMATCTALKRKPATQAYRALFAIMSSGSRSGLLRRPPLLGRHAELFVAAGLSLPVLDLAGAAAIVDHVAARARDELYLGRVLEGAAVAALAGVAGPRAFLLRRHFLGLGALGHFSNSQDKF